MGNTGYRTMRGPRNNDVACTFDGNSTETLKGVRRKSGTLRRRAARLIRKNVNELESPNAKATPTFNDEGIKTLLWSLQTGAGFGVVYFLADAD